MPPAPTDALRSPLRIALVGAVVISFSAIFFRASEVTAITGTVFRFAYALPVLALLSRRDRRADQRSWQERLIAVASGVMLAVDVVLWQSAITLIGAGLATLIANSQVVIVPVTAWLVFSERLRRRVVLAIPVVTLGMAMITGLGDEAAYGDRPVAGVMLAAVAAFFYSAFLLLLRRSNHGLAPPSRPLFDAIAGASVTATAYGAVTETADFGIDWPAHGWLLALAIGPQVVGWMLISWAMPRLPSASTSFLILLQPTLTLIWGRIFFTEIAAPIQYLGVAVVLAGIVYGTTGQSP